MSTSRKYEASGSVDFSSRADVVRMDSRHRSMPTVRVLPGGCYVTQDADEMIITILGSCIAACIRNPHTGFGGMNHFMLPSTNSHDFQVDGSALRYGNYAMEALINEVLKSGCLREELEIKLFGGACFSNGPAMVGRKNSEFALRYLAAEGLHILSTDLGGARGRRIQYTPRTGAVQRMLLKSTIELGVVQDEQDYCSRLRSDPLEGEVELFDCGALP